MRTGRAPWWQKASIICHRTEGYTRSWVAEKNRRTIRYSIHMGWISWVLFRHREIFWRRDQGLLGERMHACWKWPRGDSSSISSSCCIEKIYNNMMFFLKNKQTKIMERSRSPFCNLYMLCLKMLAAVLYWRCRIVLEPPPEIEAGTQAKTKLKLKWK